MRYAEAMTTEDVPERVITFHGRQLVVRFPTPEQLLVWQRTVKLLQAPETEGWDGEQVLRALERARKIIDSVLTEPRDRDWLDDEMLTNDLSLIDAAGIIQQTIEAFGDGKPAPAKKDAPRKRATRRKAA